MALHLHRKNEYNPDLGDDVHESRIGGFLISKYLDVEGSQQQGGRQMQQSRQEAQRTHPTHPGAKEMFTMLIDCEHVTVTAHNNNNNIEYFMLGEPERLSALLCESDSCSTCSPGHTPAGSLSPQAVTASGFLQKGSWENHYSSRKIFIKLHCFAAVLCY